MTELALRARDFASERIGTVSSLFENLSFAFPRFITDIFVAPPKIFYLTDNFPSLKQALERHTYTQSTLNVSLVNAAQQGSLDSMQLLVEYGASLPAMWNHVMKFALQAPSDRCLKKVFELCGNELAGPIDPYLETASRHNRIDLIRVLIMKGARFATEFIEHLDESRSLNPGIEAFVKLADSIISSDKNPFPMKELDRICGGTGVKIRKSDAFNRKGDWQGSNFIAVCLHAAYVASVFFPNNRSAQNSTFQKLIQSDIEKVENTTGISWKKYREMEDLRLNQVENFNDVVTEFSECVALPLTALYYETDVLKRSDAIRQATAMTLFDRKTTLDFGALSDSWHKAGNQLPDPLRPYKSLGEWVPLFQGEIELGNSISAVDLYSGKMLAAEGESMKHCVGRGSYAQQCLAGDCHIISLRQHGRPVATIQLAKTDRGILHDQGGVAWRQVQFRGHENKMPSEAAKHAWEKFCEKVHDGKLELSKSHGATAKSLEQVAITPFNKLIGFELNDAGTVIPAILEHYFTRVRAQRNSESVPLIDTTDMIEMQNRIITRLEEVEEMRKNQPAPGNQKQAEVNQAMLDRQFDEMVAALHQRNA